MSEPYDACLRHFDLSYYGESQAQTLLLEIEKVKNQTSAENRKAAEESKKATEAEVEAGNIRLKEKLLDLFTQGRLTFEQMMAFSGDSANGPSQPAQPMEAPSQPQPNVAATEPPCDPTEEKEDEHEEDDAETKENEDSKEELTTTDPEEREARFAAFYDEYCTPCDNEATPTVLVTGAYRVWSKITHRATMTKADTSALLVFMGNRHGTTRKWNEMTATSQLCYKGMILKEMAYIPLKDSDFDAFVREQCEVSYTARVPTTVLVEAYQVWRAGKRMPQMPLAKALHTARKCLTAVYPKAQGKFVYKGMHVSRGFMGLHLRNDQPREPLNGSTSDYRKQIEKVDVESNNVVHVYNSMAECNKALGKSDVTYILKKGLVVNGFKYRYKERSADVDVMGIVAISCMRRHSTS